MVKFQIKTNDCINSKNLVLLPNKTSLMTLKCVDTRLERAQNMSRV